MARNARYLPETLNYTALHQPYNDEVRCAIHLGDLDGAATVEIPTVSLSAQQLFELGNLFIQIAKNSAEADTLDEDSVHELLVGYELDDEKLDQIANYPFYRIHLPGNVSITGKAPTAQAAIDRYVDKCRKVKRVEVSYDGKIYYPDNTVNLS